MARSFLVICRDFLILYFVLSVHAEDCDKNKCKGPIRHYEDLNCNPIYEKDGDCCAIRYDCSHLRKNEKGSLRSLDKCYLNGHVYDINESIRKEDMPSACEEHCTCRKDSEEYPAQFSCISIECPQFFQRPKPECYIMNTPDLCCGTEICNKTEEDFRYCEYEGKRYKEGEKFYPKNDRMCYCLKDGENVALFCKKISCGTELRHSGDLHKNCAPVYYNSQAPQNSCSIAYRCQNKKDTVIHSDHEKTDENHVKEYSEDMLCKFGNLTMHIGDELNQATDYSSVCVKCVCEIPPTPTCQRLPDSECDVTKHPKFD